LSNKGFYFFFKKDQAFLLAAGAGLIRCA
jgi:hypothetical protein